MDLRPRRLARWTAVLASVLLGLAVRQVAAQAPDAFLSLRTVSLSPDARSIAFDYCAGDTCGIGVLDPDSPRPRLLPNPPDGELIGPSFSNDGGRLVASLGCRCGEDDPRALEVQLVIVDPADGRLDRVTRGPGARVRAGFAAGSDDVIAVDIPVGDIGGRRGFRPEGQRLVVVDGRTGAVRPLAAAAYRELKRPSFIAAGAVVFVARLDAAAHAELDPAALGRLGSPGTDDLVLFTQALDGPPAAAALDVAIPAMSVSAVAASRDPQRLVIAGTRRLPQTPAGVPLVRLYLVEGGRIVSLGGLVGDLHGLAISGDGSRVAVLDHRGEGHDELFIIDVATRIARHVPLRDRLLEMKAAAPAR